MIQTHRQSVWAKQTIWTSGHSNEYKAQSAKGSSLGFLLRGLVHSWGREGHCQLLVRNEVKWMISL